VGGSELQAKRKRKYSTGTLAPVGDGVWKLRVYVGIDPITGRCGPSEIPRGLL
jgi:hypothetical protein